MGQITLTARIDANNVFKGVVQISDANVRKIIDTYRNLHFPEGVNTGTPQAPVYRPATDQEVILRLADLFVADLRATARRLDQLSAAKTAEAAVPEIPADPAAP